MKIGLPSIQRRVHTYQARVVIAEEAIIARLVKAVGTLVSNALVVLLY